MNLWRSLTRSAPQISLDDYLAELVYNGNIYGTGINQTLQGKKEELDTSYRGLIQGAAKGNGVIFACMLARMLPFSEVRFAFRQTGAAQRAKLYDDPMLDIFVHPWPNGHMRDLSARAIQDVDLAGNFFAVRRNQRGPRPNRIRRLRPDWVTILLGSETDSDVQAGDIDAEVVGYLYHPGGMQSGRDPVSLLPEQVAHWAPVPDPAALFRGMSWLQPIVREIQADTAATSHKLKFFENGATANMVVKLDEKAPEKFQKWVKDFEDRHEGVTNAYRTLFFGAGADVQVVGANLQQLDFKVVQGAGETRIAAAAGVPPVIVGLSEGLASATYSNYAQARRRYADLTLRPHWGSYAASMAVLVDVPANRELWYDDRDIPFLREDATDATTIRQTQAASIQILINSGFEAQSAVDAVTTGDWELLKHTGMVSVQLLPPGTEKNPSSGNGNAPPDMQMKSVVADKLSDRATDALLDLISERLALSSGR